MRITRINEEDLVAVETGGNLCLFSRRDGLYVPQEPSKVIAIDGNDPRAKALIKELDRKRVRTADRDPSPEQ